MTGAEPPGPRRRGASANGLLRVALILALAFAFTHLLGLRQNMSILSGTASGTLVSREFSAILALLYLTSYAGLLLLVPTLVVAAGLLTLRAALTRRR